MKNKKGKKGFRLVLALSLFILLAVNARAELTIDSEFKKIYNLGDQLRVSGKLLYDFDSQGILSLKLRCGAPTTLKMRTITISEGVEFRFSEFLAIPPDIRGACTLLAEYQTSDFNEATESPQFTITNELSGDFSVEKDSIQLGQINTIKGKITKMNGEPLVGIANIYFNQNNNLRLFDRINILNGSFSYVFNSTQNYAGEYEIRITAKDIYGNEKTFGPFSFLVDNKIIIEASVPEMEYKPGDNMPVNGKITTALPFRLDEAEIIITFNNKQYKTKSKGNFFSYQLVIPDGLKAGSHFLHFAARDDFGNKGSYVITYKVAQVPTSLITTLSTDKAVPGDTIIVNSEVRDQSFLIIRDAAVSVSLIDINKNIIFGLNNTDGNNVEIRIPDYLAPGNYIIQTKSGSASKDIDVVIETLEKLLYEVNGSTVVFRNKGNVPVDKDIVINMKDTSGKSYDVERHVSLLPDGKLEVNLNKEVPGETYLLSVPSVSNNTVELTTTDERSFLKKISMDFITGQTVNVGSGGSILMMLIVLAAAGFFYYKIKAVKQGSVSGKSFSVDKEAEKLNEYLKSKREEKKLKEEEPRERKDPAVQKFIKESLEKSGEKVPEKKE